MLNALYETAWKRVAASATSSHLNSGDWVEVLVIIIITCALSLPVGLNTGEGQCLVCVPACLRSLSPAWR